MLLELLKARETVRSRHPNIEHDDVRLGQCDDSQRLGGRSCRPDDVEVTVLLERHAHDLDHQPVVVGEHNSDSCHRATLPLRRSDLD